MADALKTPVAVMKTAGEGGAWGMALLAPYMICGEDKSLPDFLNERVFVNMEQSILSPHEDGKNGFDK